MDEAAAAVAALNRVDADRADDPDYACDTALRAPHNAGANRYVNVLPCACAGRDADWQMTVHFCRSRT